MRLNTKTWEVSTLSDGIYITSRTFHTTSYRYRENLTHIPRVEPCTVPITIFPHTAAPWFEVPSTTTRSKVATHPVETSTGTVTGLFDEIHWMRVGE